MAESQPTHERWLPVVGYEYRYEVSDQGRVRAKARTFWNKNGQSRHMPTRILSTKPGTGGYPRVFLEAEDGSRSIKVVHRLILEAFVGPCPEGFYGCHWDDNPQNNDLSNLRWASPSDNVRDAIRNGTHGMTQRSHCPQGHPYSMENTYRYKHKTNVRRCKTCAADEQRRRRDKRRAVRVAT